MDNMNREKQLKLVFGDYSCGVHGEHFHYIFSYQRGGLESLVLDGREWLYRVPKPAFWRATTDNDRGCGFGLTSGMWLAADMFISCVGIQCFVNGREIPFPGAPENNRYTGMETAENVCIRYTYQTITVPTTMISVSYMIAEAGSIRIEIHYYGKEGLPELPVLGMRFLFPTKATGFCYEGLSGETYPDRMAGGIPGVYQVKGLPVTKYLVPQDCGVHMDTKWVEIYRNSTLNRADHRKGTFGIRIRAAEDKKFAFSCIPYTPQELENATHMEELPAARRTVLTVMGAVRGVGGINSWGADVDGAYHIDATKDITYSFILERTNRD